MDFYDIHVVGQGILYFVISFLGVVTAIPLGATLIHFGGRCCLYTEFQWVNATYADVSLSYSGLCSFPVYTAVLGCTFYGLGVGVYHMYAACRSKDPTIGYQMWVMPFLLVNTLVTFLMFITCCVVSIGLKSTCDSFLHGKEKGREISSCTDATSYDWNVRQGKPKTDYSYSQFYSLSRASEVVGWATVFAWLIQLGLCIFRLVRNRKNRSNDMDGAYDEASADGKAAGMESIVANYM